MSNERREEATKDKETQRQDMCSVDLQQPLSYWSVSVMRWRGGIMLVGVSAALLIAALACVEQFLPTTHRVLFRGAAAPMQRSLAILKNDPHSTVLKPRIWRYAKAPCVEEYTGDEGRFSYDWQRKHPTLEGFIFARPTKTGSTSFTFALTNAAKRLAQRQQQKNPNIDFCRFQAVHEKATQMNYAERNRDTSYLFSLLRKPNKRSISQFFYNGLTLNRKDKKPTANYFEEFLLHNPINLHGTYIDQLRFDPQLQGMPAVQHIMHAYDFIGITERMDESMVVWSLLLDLDLEDILYLKSNEGGGWASIPGQCFEVPKTVVTREMQAFLASPEWQSIVHWDDVLYKYANQSLDATIDNLGRHAVEQKVLMFKRMQRQVELACRPVTKSPCTAEGLYQEDNDCLRACGMPCLDTFRPTA